MGERPLEHRRILVVEDEYLLADELQTELSDAGAVVLGPVGTLQTAMDLINQEQDIDGAVLDINLRGEMVYPAADLLLSRGTPIVFSTGYDASAILSRFKHVARCEKPVTLAKIMGVIGRMISTGTP